MWNNNKEDYNLHWWKAVPSDCQGWGWRDEIDCERSQGTFGGDENGLYLDGGGVI